MQARTWSHNLLYLTFSLLDHIIYRMSRLFLTSLLTSSVYILLPLGLCSFPPTFPIHQTIMNLVPQLVVRSHYVCQDYLSLPYLSRLFASCCPLGLHTSPLTFPIPQTSSTWFHNPHPDSAVSFSRFCSIPCQFVLGHPLFGYSFCGQIPIMLQFK